MAMNPKDFDIDEEFTGWISDCIREKIDNVVYWKSLIEAQPDWHEFTVTCVDKDREEDIADVYAWVVEQFGLPGERYHTHPEKELLKFRFKNIKDYEWMALRWT